MIDLHNELLLINRVTQALNMARAAVNDHDVSLHSTVKQSMTAAMAPAIFAELTKLENTRAHWDRRHEPQG